MKIQARFDPLIHAPNRLQICAFLSPLEFSEFRVLRETLGVSDSVLSKHLKQLEEAGYIKQKKTKRNNRPTTWVYLTKKGRNTFEQHLAELKRIIAQSESSNDGT